MVDVMKSLDLGFVFSNPGSSILGLHESVTVYGGNIGLKYAAMNLSAFGVLAHEWGRGLEGAQSPCDNASQPRRIHIVCRCNAFGRRCGTRHRDH